MGNRAYWNKKFEDRTDILMQPEELLLKDKAVYNFGKKGLELACGDGRNLLSLAKQGHEVVGVDFSQKGLERLQSFAQKEDIRIQTILGDLSDLDFLKYIDKYDFIYINHFRLKKQMYPHLEEHLNDGGFLWINGFSEVPTSNKEITKEDVLIEEDFGQIKLNQIDYRAYQIKDRKYIRALFKK
jgi:2-polyprenyl-3-methyl-5-hydroxy-6-metoxy-1,4-benzoquinol methylase